MDNHGNWNKNQQNHSFKKNNWKNGHKHNKKQFYKGVKPTFNNGQHVQQDNHQENKELFCKSCDRSFFNDFKYQQHLSEHRTCGIDGCTFNAHQKLIEDHINLQHITGLYDKIKNVSTPEDIEKWREERRKNHACTKGSIEKKIKLKEEMEKRGERIQKNENKFGRNNNRLSLSRPNRNKPNNRNNQQKPQSKDKKIERRNRSNKRLMEKPEESLDKSDWNGSMFPFRGTKSLCEAVEETVAIDDHLWDDGDVVVKPKSVDDKKANALSCLIAAYGSSDESETEAVTVTDVPKNIESLNAISDDDEAPSEEKIVRQPDGDYSAPDSVGSKKIDGPIKNLNQNKEKAKRDNKRKAKGDSEPGKVYYKRRRVTLLEKLLENDIRHERNALLQCVRYVVNNNFFDKTK